VFCAEALWTFFLPRYDVIRQLLDDEVLGDVHTVLADNGEWLPPTHRIHRHDLAGGPLLDLGTYPFALANWVLGPPELTTAIGRDVPGGEVNGQVSALSRHRDAAQSTFNTTIMAGTPTQAVLAGTRATLVIDGPSTPPATSPSSRPERARLCAGPNRRSPTRRSTSLPSKPPTTSP
jgi:predicted dehydrogenase